METINFCPACGQKKLENASFCFQCGAALRRPFNAALWVALGVVVVLSAGLFAVIRGLGLNKQVATAETAQAAGTETEHVHVEPPEMQALKQRAAKGDAAAMMDLAEMQIKMGSRDQDFFMMAAGTLEAFLGKHPRHAYALRLLGNLYYDLGMVNEAVGAYSKYLELFPEDANVRTDYGVMLLSQGNVESAIQQFQRATEIFPDLYHAYFNLAVAYRKHGDEETAAGFDSKAAEVAQRAGKNKAPEFTLPRLPAGVSDGGMSDGGNPHVVGSGVSGKYAPLEQFFLNHPIVGPKVFSFKVEGDKAILYVRDFPMDAMPVTMKESFDGKIELRLQEIESPAALEIRDAQDRRVMAEYSVP